MRTNTVLGPILVLALIGLPLGLVRGKTITVASKIKEKKILKGSTKGNRLYTQGLLQGGGEAGSWPLVSEFGGGTTPV